MRLDDELLAEYARSFYGYGRYEGRYWLIGIEEGGGSPEEVTRRVETWRDRGKRELDDVAEVARVAVDIDWFSPNPPIQQTWGRLIRLLLTAQNEAVHKDTVRRFQQRSMGRRDSDNCWLELKPLPAKSIGTWLYGNHSGLSWLRSREEYERYIIPERATHLRQRINEFQPKAVIFYSYDRRMLEVWRDISGVELEQRGSERIAVGARDGTVYLAVEHPQRERRNWYFDRAGQSLRQLLRDPDATALASRPESQDPSVEGFEAAAVSDAALQPLDRLSQATPDGDPSSDDTAFLSGLVFPEWFYSELRRWVDQERPGIPGLVCYPPKKARLGVGLALPGT